MVETRLKVRNLGNWKEGPWKLKTHFEKILAKVAGEANARVAVELSLPLTDKNVMTVKYFVDEKRVDDLTKKIENSEQFAKLINDQIPNEFDPSLNFVIANVGKPDIKGNQIQYFV